MSTGLKLTAVEPMKPKDPESSATLLRSFNTALIGTQKPSSSNLAQELASTIESPAFQSILAAVRSLANETGIPESQAAAQLIETFRKVDRLWSEYVYAEGLDVIQRQLG